MNAEEVTAATVFIGAGLVLIWVVCRMVGDVASSDVDGGDS